MLDDLNGKVILSKRLFEGSNIVDVESIPKGIYFANFKEAGNKIFTRELVKI